MTRTPPRAAAPKFRRLAFAIAASVALGVCASTIAVDTAEAKTFRIADQGDAMSMDPHSLNESLQLSFTGNIYEPLVAHDKKLGLVPGLATKWTQVNPTTWRFELRRGVTFHDGAAFNADDVVFSINRALAPTSNFGIYVDTVGEVVKIDDFTVEVVTKIPDPILPNKLASVFIMDKEWSEANNVRQPQNTRAREETHTVRNTNGTGAFRLTAREPDVRTVLVRNNDWWGGKEKGFDGNVTEVIYTPIGNDGWSFGGTIPIDLAENLITHDGLRGPDLRERIAFMSQRQVRLAALVEQLPDKDNRVTLSKDKKDALGIPYPRIEYSVDDYTSKGLEEARKMADQIFDALGVSFRQHQPDFFGAGHIIGTHVMGTDPATSVTDPDGRTHDHPNLFLAGCGSFPTSATANPTLTLAALVLRTADIMKKDLGTA